MYAFLPGIAEIVSYCNELSVELDKRELRHMFTIYLLHSQIEDQNEVFMPPTPNTVHVILSTNILLKVQLPFQDYD